MTFWMDRTALLTAVIGIILMIFAIVWRINPVEGSVLPDFLKHNPVGNAVILSLLVTCLPVMMLGIGIDMMLSNFFSSDFSSLFLVPMLLVFQGLLYFMIGKLISFCVGKYFGGKKGA